MKLVKEYGKVSKDYMMHLWNLRVPRLERRAILKEIELFAEHLKRGRHRARPPLADVTTEDIMRYYADLGQRYKTAQTIDKHFNMIKDFFQYLYDIGYIDESPVP